MNAPFDALPLVVGLTGHRDPPDAAEAPLRKRFGEILDGLRQRHPTLRPFVLSGLAAGADIFAAEEAIERGVAVLGCLPMPQAEYERDFAPEELERFRRVLLRCSDVVVVGTSDRRQQNYVDVANFIAYYSHVLVAFWDGLPARGPGGTAQVVDLRQHGSPSVAADALVTYMPDVGPVIQIVTPRKDQPPPAQPFTVHETYPQRPGWKTGAKRAAQDAGEQEFEDALDHLARFDQDLAAVPASKAADRLRALGDRTDSAANRLQARTLRSLQSVYIATALAGAAQLVLPTDGSFHIPTWAGIAARIAFLAVALAVFAVAKRNDFENRYQDYRAIAEALRVQSAWNAAGMRLRFVESAYLQMQQSELEWIRLALRTAYLVCAVAGPARDDGAPAPAQAVGWVESQVEYYEAAGKREKRRLERAHLAMLLLVIAGGALSAGASAFAWMLSNGWLPSSSAASDPVLTYWATMPFALGSMLALLIRFYVQQRGYGENARRYQHMFTVFDAARRRLRERPDDPRAVLEQLGREALTEHAEWLILHRDRPLTFVHT